MLAFDYIREGRSLSLELPVPIDTLAGELRAFGINERLHQIHRADFLLQPTNELGEHFMKLVQPDDTLYSIAAASQEIGILEGDSRQALVDLIMTDRLHNLDHMADYLHFGPAALDHYVRLRLGERNVDLPTQNLFNDTAVAGLDRPPNDIRLNEVGYLPLNEQGKQLLMELSPYESLAAANLACTLLTVPDITASMREVAESARRLLPPRPTETMNFYCPLAVRVEDGNGDLVKGDPFLLRVHEDAISDALRNEMLLPDDNMARHMQRCSQALRDKVASAVWDVGKMGGNIYGIIRCELYAPLTAVEKAELTDWVTSQNFDGFGETVEQTPIETTDGEIFVCFGDSDPGYFVYDQEQFEQYLNGGGPEVVPSAAEPQKPDCPLIGQDSNVFNLIGIAARTLRQNGLADQAKEMSARAFASGSYDQALGIITEYVNPTSVFDDMDEDEDEDWLREPEYDEDDWPEEEQGFGEMGGMS